MHPEPQTHNTSHVSHNLNSESIVASPSTVNEEVSTSTPRKLDNNLELLQSDDINELEAEWQYQLPSPPKAFRDSSPTNFTDLTNYDTVTFNGLTDNSVVTPVKDSTIVSEIETISEVDNAEKMLNSKYLSIENLEKRQALVLERELASLKVAQHEDNLKSNVVEHNLNVTLQKRENDMYIVKNIEKTNEKIENSFQKQELQLNINEKTSKNYEKILNKQESLDSASTHSDKNNLEKIQQRRKSDEFSTQDIRKQENDLQKNENDYRNVEKFQRTEENIENRQHNHNSISNNASAINNFDKHDIENYKNKKINLINEVEDVIKTKTTTLSRTNSQTREKILSDSTLPNFKITTYDQPKSKINIFEDDSIRSNVDTKSNDLNKRNSIAEINMSDKNYLAKRNSLGNSSTENFNFDENIFKKLDPPKYTKINSQVKQTSNDSIIMRSESFSQNNVWVKGNPVKRSKSQVSLEKYNNDIKTSTENEELQKSSSMWNVSGLQSLEVN